MREVTSEAWAAFVIQYRYICYGAGEDVMKVWDIPSREPLSVVEYLVNGGIRYWINVDTKAEVTYAS